MAEDEVALQILNIIEGNPRVSQRKITMQTGVAAGLVHSFMSRVINKGWVRAKQVSAKRWLYFLTPKGFIEKGRLSMNYISRVFTEYREIQDYVDKVLEQCHKNGWLKLAIVGGSDFSEIAILNLKARNVFQLVGLFNASNAGKVILNHTVQPYEELIKVDYDKVLICDDTFIEWKIKNGNCIDDKKIFNMF